MVSQIIGIWKIWVSLTKSECYSLSSSLLHVNFMAVQRVVNHPTFIAESLYSGYDITDELACWCGISRESTLIPYHIHFYQGQSKDIELVVVAKDLWRSLEFKLKRSLFRIIFLRGKILIKCLWWWMMEFL